MTGERSHSEVSYADQKRGVIPDGFAHGRFEIEKPFVHGRRTLPVEGDHLARFAAANNLKGIRRWA
jgi:hypothetical protein